MMKDWSRIARYTAQCENSLAVCEKCGGGLGDVFDLAPLTTPTVYQDNHHRLILDFRVNPPQGNHGAVLRFQPGFVLREDGLWALAKRARQRLLWRRKFGRTVYPDQTGPFILRRVVDGHTGEVIAEFSSRPPAVIPPGEPTPLLRRQFIRPRADGRVQVQEYTPHELPCFVACPKCDSVNRIEAEALGIELAPYLREIKAL
jgi:hypothetical protein